MCENESDRDQSSLEAEVVQFCIQLVLTRRNAAEKNPTLRQKDEISWIKNVEMIKDIVYCKKVKVDCNQHSYYSRLSYSDCCSTLRYAKRSPALKWSSSTSSKIIKRIEETFRPRFEVFPACFVF